MHVKSCDESWTKKIIVLQSLSDDLKKKQPGSEPGSEPMHESAVKKNSQGQNPRIRREETQPGSEPKNPKKKKEQCQLQAKEQCQQQAKK